LPKEDLLQINASGPTTAAPCAALKFQEAPMFRVAIVVWIILGTALAGTALLVVLAVPDLAAQAMKNIPRAALAGFAVAMPLSFLVARKISPAR
jgi:hypothetical protein